MSQMGVIVVDDCINVNAWIEKVKAEIPKAKVGSVETNAKKLCQQSKDDLHRPTLQYG